MDNTREKLIELIGSTEYGNKSLIGHNFQKGFIEKIADHLIANGVTFQKWIPITERLPKSQKIVLASAKSKTFGYRHTLMVAHIGHHEITTEEYGWQEYEGETEYDEEKDCFWIPECWYEVNSVEDNGNWIIDSDYEVTHWTESPKSAVQADSCLDINLHTPDKKRSQRCSAPWDCQSVTLKGDNGNDQEADDGSETRRHRS